ncbi:MAG: BMC domain-containing protein [Blastocatellia bacterium]
MTASDPTGEHHCIGFVETSSIAKGIEATDAMMKMAEVELLMTTIIPRGKYLIMIGGNVADVESSLRAGLATAAGTVLDHFIIPNVHSEMFPAIRGRVKIDRIEAIGIIETREVASAIYAGDAAVKSANIKLIEARNQPGGKGLVVLTGEVGAVRTAVAAGVATIKKDGMLVGEVIIPYAHEALLKSLVG